MENANDYLKSKFERLPLSHQNFILTSQRAGARPPQLVGKKIHPKYQILYIDYDSLYKPITTYL